MGLVQFIKDAGTKLFGGSGAQKTKTAQVGKAAQGAQGAQGAQVAAPVDTNVRDASAAQAILAYIGELGLAPKDLSVQFDSAKGVATVSGTAPDQATRELILLAAGNVHGVGAVDDRMTVSVAGQAARFHTVVRGDTLSAIAKQYYGNAGKYPVIFEANKPMLVHPDKIYPGQVLRIPDLP